MPVEAYKIWYSDGSWSTDWETSPDEDVQIVMLYHPDGYRTIQHGLDEYIDPTGQCSRVKLGKWMLDDKYDSLIKTALL